MPTIPATPIIVLYAALETTILLMMVNISHEDVASTCIMYLLNDLVTIRDFRGLGCRSTPMSIGDPRICVMILH